MIVSLTGKRALVGGATSGIGKAVAQQFASSGASVTLMARNEDKLRQLRDTLDTESHQKHEYLVVDFSNYDEFCNILSNYFSANSVDILVNNTQGPDSGGALEKKVEDYQRAFELLFKTVVYTTQLALDQMMERKWGRIINVASVSVREPLSYLALSNSIRAAVVTWGKSLATDVGPYGITVNSILTGFFDTERLAQLNSKKAEKMGIKVEEVLQAMEGLTALKRIGHPAEYGYLTAFLASENAAFITGTAIPIDGGYLKSL